MFKRKRNAFTLIELIAVLVIMAIIALIVTPLVMNIIRKARISADRRSVDAYGRSIELAIASYLLDTGRFPTSIDQLTIEYSGNEVVCETTQLNSDSSVYLTGCTVAGRSTGDYEYGKLQVVTYDTYSVGDEVTYNGVDYYVIENSDSKQLNVKLLKKEPLSSDEIIEYSPGADVIGGGVGNMMYHSNSNEYDGSYIKTTLDAWKVVNAPETEEVRLITVEDLINLGYIKNSETSYSKGENLPNWLYNGLQYWTMSSYNGSSNRVWYMVYDGRLTYNDVNLGGKVRPVIILSKSEISA